MTIQLADHKDNHKLMKSDSHFWLKYDKSALGDL